LRTVHQVILSLMKFIFWNFISSIIRFSFVPTCLGMFTRWCTSFDEVLFFGELHLSFAFHLIPPHFEECCFIMWYFWWSSFSRNFMECFLSFVPHLLEKCSPCVNLMKFIFFGNLMQHVFSFVLTIWGMFTRC
jgi:hypothetical protein